MGMEKLPSGSYRVKRQIDGVRYCITFDHYPKKAEIEKAFADRIMNPKTIRTMTFYDAANQFFHDKDHVLSPSTLRGYHNNLNGLSENFKNTKIDDLTAADVQREVNRLAGNLAPKTVKNYNGFISSILSLYRPDLKLSTKLPMIAKKDPYVPNSEDVRRILEEARGTVYELPIMLGCLGMRRSEICALDESCLEGNTLHIYKSMVQDEHNEWIIKDYPKTSSSARDIYIPDKIVDLIDQHGFYHGHPHTISDWMRRTQDHLCMPHFTLHKLRHYFASESHAQGIADADIQAFGGWETDHVMKRVYRHAMDNSKNVSDSITSNLF